MTHHPTFYKTCGLVLAIMLAVPLAFCEEELPKRLSAVYPDLPQGVLVNAVLEELPDTDLVHIKGKPVTLDMLAAKVADLPEDTRANIENYLFYVLENMIKDTIMMVIITGDDMSDVSTEAVNQKIKTYLMELMGSVEVTETEARTFYDQNPHIFPELAYDDIKDDLKRELVQQKQRSIWETHLRDAGAKIPLSINAKWVAEQAEKAKDNPVDKARTADKPLLAIFSAEWCPSCKQLKPVISELQGGKIEAVEFVIIDMDNYGFLGSRYNVSSIPTLVFFDKQGYEVERHTGFMDADKLLFKLQALAKQ